MVSTRDRHGRVPRSDVKGIASARANGRSDFFEAVTRDVISYLSDVQPELMSNVRVDMATLPYGELADGVPRLWTPLRPEGRVILYRILIERGVKLHRNDEWHRRNNIETVTIEAIADLLGVDPYDLAPNRYFPHA